MSAIALSELLKSIDSKDPDAFIAFLSEGAVFRYGSQAPVKGKAAIREYVEGFFGTVAALQHRVLRTWEEESSLVCQGEVTYTKHDGGEVTVPFTNIFGLEDGKISDYLVYVDPTPLMS